jgi:hypothetical protein
MLKVVALKGIIWKTLYRYCKVEVRAECLRHHSKCLVETLFSCQCPFKYYFENLLAVLGPFFALPKQTYNFDGVVQQYIRSTASSKKHCSLFMCDLILIFEKCLGSLAWVWSTLLYRGILSNTVHWHCRGADPLKYYWLWIYVFAELLHNHSLIIFGQFLEIIILLRQFLQKKMAVLKRKCVCAAVPYVASGTCNQPIDVTQHKI